MSRIVSEQKSCAPPNWMINVHGFKMFPFLWGYLPRSVGSHPGDTPSPRELEDLGRFSWSNGWILHGIASGEIDGIDMDDLLVFWIGECENFWKGPAFRSQTPTTNLWQCNSSQLTMSKMNLFKGLGECILLIHYEIRNLMGAKWKTSESPWHCCKKELVLLN